MSDFNSGRINGIVINNMAKNADNRGWLIELFRKDSLEDNLLPDMAYISLTYPGIARGPHEHRDQTDYFCFLGSSTFRLLLWDTRKASPTYGNKMILEVGESDQKIVIVPPGVVHAYKNIGEKPGLVINLPNRLYAGWGKKETVDEIRYEDDPNSPFKID
jgi:dTDP-4-dehydrorhamnose 3,5-epimerase